jgi:ATP-binding cassette subfamily C protein LapB
MVYSYRQEDDSPALVIPQLSIAAGEKVAVIGRIGSGKSTLLRLLAGQAEPRSGSIVLDDTMMAQIDMADLRRDIGYMSQTGDLFYGSIRENLRIANPGATDAEIAAALRLSCADRLLQKQANGLDLQIGEGGTGVSNGQRQSLLLARLILRDPNIVLLDEPTASLDEGTERLLIDNLKGWLQGRTLVVATHRFPILELVDRLIVIESGRILMDGPKAEILQRLKSG